MKDNNSVNGAFVDEEEGGVAQALEQQPLSTTTTTNNNVSVSADNGYCVKQIVRDMRIVVDSEEFREPSERLAVQIEDGNSPHRSSVPSTTCVSGITNTASNSGSNSSKGGVGNTATSLATGGGAHLMVGAHRMTSSGGVSEGSEHLDTTRYSIEVGEGGPRNSNCDSDANFTETTPRRKSSTTTQTVLEATRVDDLTLYMAEPAPNAAHKQQNVAWYADKRLYIGIAFGLIVSVIATLSAMGVFKPKVRSISTLSPSLSPSMVPTQSPTRCLECIPDLLLSATNATHDSTMLSMMEEVGTPQNSALNWILNDPDISFHSNERVYQRYALAVLFFATGGGTDWNNNNGWLDYSVSECDWYGLSCESEDEDNGEQTGKLAAFQNFPFKTQLVRHSFIEGSVCAHTIFDHSLLLLAGGSVIYQFKSKLIEWVNSIRASNVNKSEGIRCTWEYANWYDTSNAF